MDLVNNTIIMFVNKKSFLRSLLLLLLTATYSYGQETLDVTIEQHPTIKNTPVNSITVDLNNSKWIGTETRLFVFDRWVENPTVMKRQGVFSTIMGENETGWVGLHSNKIGMFDRDITYSTGIPDEDMIHTMAVQRNTIWLGTSEGLHKISLKSKDQSELFKVSNSKIPSNQINDLYVDKDGVKWIATENGLAAFNDKKWTIHLKDNNITAITEHNGDLWVAGEQKLWVFKGFTTFEERSLIDEFKASPIEDMVFDSQGNLWLACQLLGCYNSEWVPFIYGERSGFTSTQVLSLAMDHSDNLWVGTAGKGLFRVQIHSKKNSNTFAFADTQKETPTTMTASLVKAKGGNTKGISAPSPSKKKAKKTPLLVNSMFVGNRIIKPGKEVGVKDQKIKIAVWDGQAQDGDTISLFYNGDCILKEYDLSKDRFYITLDVKPNSANQLVLYAHSQGARGVNTAMVALLHRDRPKEWMALTSDTQRCDKINFKLVK